MGSHIFLHVEWFVDASRYPVQWGLLFSSRSGLTIAVSAVALAALTGLQRLLGDPSWPNLRLFQRMAHGAPTLVAVQAAITLVFYGAQGTWLSPADHPRPGWIAVAVGGLEILVAFTFITSLLDWAGAVVLALVVAAGFFVLPPLDAVANLFWLGIATTTFFAGRIASDQGDIRPWLRSLGSGWSARSVATLRVTTGLAVIGPALSEKIWNPAIGAAFLHGHPQFNFLHHYFGVSWMTDDRFVLAAGIAEFAIGALLISGVLTRVVILAMWVPFSITIPFLPPTELLGHLPIFAIMYVLLVHGAGIAPGEPGAKQRLRGSPDAADSGHDDEGAGAPQPRP